MRRVTANNLPTRDGRVSKIGAACRLGNVLVSIERPGDRAGSLDHIPVWLTLAQAKRVQGQINTAVSRLAKSKER